MKRRLIGITLVVVMLCSLISPAFANNETVIAELLGGSGTVTESFSNQEELAEKCAEAITGDVTLRLLSDIELEYGEDGAAVVLQNGATLDLNGHTLTISGTPIDASFCGIRTLKSVTIQNGKILIKMTSDSSSQDNSDEENMAYAIWRFGGSLELDQVEIAVANDGEELSAAIFVTGDQESGYLTLKNSIIGAKAGNAIMTYDDSKWFDPSDVKIVSGSYTNLYTSIEEGTFSLPEHVSLSDGSTVLNSNLTGVTAGTTVIKSAATTAIIVENGNAYLYDSLQDAVTAVENGRGVSEDGTTPTIILMKTTNEEVTVKTGSKFKIETYQSSTGVENKATFKTQNGCVKKAADGTYTAGDHTWDDGTVTTSATCTTEGVKTYTCTSCNATKTEPIAAGHKMTKTDAKPATQSAEGNLEYWHCSVCGGYFKDEQGTEQYVSNAWILPILPNEGDKQGVSYCMYVLDEENVNICDLGMIFGKALPVIENSEYRVDFYTDDSTEPVHYGWFDSVEKNEDGYYKLDITPWFIGNPVDGVKDNTLSVTKAVVNQVAYTDDTKEKIAEVTKVCETDQKLVVKYNVGKPVKINNINYELQHDEDGYYYDITITPANGDTDAVYAAFIESADGEEQYASVGQTLVDGTMTFSVNTDCGNWKFWVQKVSMDLKSSADDDDSELVAELSLTPMDDGTLWEEPECEHNGTLTAVEAKSATYSVEGNLAYWFCEVCHKYFKDEDASEEYAENGWVIAKLKRSSSNSSSSTTTKTDTTTNKDGSTTTTETKSDGTKVETTTNTDGSTTKTETKTETKTDGSSVTTEVKTETKTDGTKTEVTSEVTTATDGTTTKTETAKTTDASGSTGTTTTVTDATGTTTVTADATVSAKAVETAQSSDKAVTIPVEVKATSDTKTAATVNINIEVKSSGQSDKTATVKVEVPVTNVDSGTVAVLVKADGTEEIIKTTVPTENGVAISVEGNVTIKVVDNSKTFEDTTSHWSKDEVNFVASREIFNGVGGGNFGVSEPMTRGMVNTVLARLAGEDTNGGENWYDKGNEWAVKNGVSDGTNPTDSVTREQLATMLYRYAGSPEVSGDINFADSSAISEYAQKALLWATQNGIINGMGDGNIAPSAEAERAQVAAMMARFLKNL